MYCSLNVVKARENHIVRRHDPTVRTFLSQEIPACVYLTLPGTSCCQGVSLRVLTVDRCRYEVSGCNAASRLLTS